MTAPPVLPAAAWEKIGPLGSTFYLDDTTVARAKELGLSGFRFLIMGRGGVLGDVDAEVVTSALGYFGVEVIREEWDGGREVIHPRNAAREFFESCAAFGRAKLSGLAGLDDLCEVLEAVNAAADPAGLALYSGARAMTRADDSPARVMQLMAVLHEYRSSVNILAFIANLLDPRLPHYLRDPKEYALFGYAEPPQVSAEERARLAEAREMALRIAAPAFAVLGEAGSETLLRGLGAVEAVIRA